MVKSGLCAGGETLQEALAGPDLGPGLHSELWDILIRAGPRSHSLGKASLGSILTDVCVSAVVKESTLDYFGLLAIGKINITKSQALRGSTKDSHAALRNND